MSNICIFSAQYLPHMGGVENYTYNLAKYLTKCGDQVVVVTSNIGNLPDYEMMENVLVVRMPCLNFMNGRYPFLICNKKFYQLQKKLMQYSFDLVLVNTRFYPHSVYGGIFAKMQHARCIMLEHGTSHMTVHNKIADLVEHTVEHTLTWIDKRLCKEYYGVSQACGEWLKHFHIQSSGVLYNAVDLEKIENIKKTVTKEYRKKYQIPDNSIVVTFTGRLLKEKGIYQLIESVKKLQKEGYSVYLFLAGDGDERENIEKLADESIIPLGRIDMNQIVSLLEESDIFCLPSDSEGFPTSVLEAVACHCYIITTETGGAKEMITSREYGMILQDNRVEIVTNGLREALQHSKERESIVEKTYTRLSENYTWEIVAGKVHDLAQWKNCIQK